jgi:hypothetical protein
MGNIMDNLEKNSSDNIEHLKKIYFWRSAFFGLVILTAGIVIGGASMSIFASHNIGSSPPPRQYGNLIPRLTRTLGLTQQQIDKIKPILDKNMQKLWDIREDARIDIVNTLDQMNKEIAPILAENQKLVWSNELLRIQRDVSPEPLRNNAAGNRRGGAAQPGQDSRLAEAYCKEELWSLCLHRIRRILFQVKLIQKKILRTKLIQIQLNDFLYLI